MQLIESAFLENKLATVGDIITFERNNHTYEGTVFIVRDNSVLVKISPQAAKMLGYEQPNTVVGHRNYIVS